jgi:arabinogalactan oligomer/maltooligosaccharide transport system substrate-binding protein
MMAEKELPEFPRLATRWALRVLSISALVLAVPVAATDLTVWTSLPFGEKTALQKKETLEKIVTAYNAKRGSSALKVTVRFFEFDGFADRLARLVPRGKGPDIFMYPQDRLGGWIATGNTVEPLDRFIGTAVRERFIPVTAQAMVYRGHTYGLPYGFNTITLIYNKKLVSSPPKSTAELLTFAKKFTNQEAGVYGFGYGYANYYQHAALQNGFGGHAFDEQWHPTMNCLENVKAMRLLLSWLDVLPKESWTDEHLISLFNEGKLAIVFSGQWILSDISSSIDYGIARLPTISEANDRPMRPWITVEGLYLAATSPQKEAAFDFMQYATDFDSARMQALAGGGFTPANQKIWLDPSVESNKTQVAFVKQALVGVPMPNVPEMTVMWPAAFAAMNGIVHGTSTPEEALAKAQAKMSMELAVFRRPRPPPGPGP